MNLFKRCSFYDRFRNSFIDINDLIEENYVKNKDNLFNLMFYFTANWLPDSFNKTLNEKLKNFYFNQKENFENFDLVFVSSDKTIDSYKEFMDKNRFIRYSLEFREQDLKSELYKFFNINGIPYLTIVSFRLDHDLKIIDLFTEKANIKHEILCTENWTNFPWFKQDALLNESIDMDRLILDELLRNLTKLNVSETNQEEILNQIPAVFKNEYNFIYLLFGTNKYDSNDLVFESIVEFWKAFHVKHKFIVVYLQLDNKNDLLPEILTCVDWYTVKKRAIKEKLCRYYEVTSLPKLLILDSKTGEMLNDKIKFALFEHIHEFCTRQIDNLNNKQNKFQQSIEQKQSNFKLNMNFNLNFDFDSYEIISHKSGSKQNNKLKKVKKRRIDGYVMKELSENLIDMSTGAKFVLDKETITENEPTIDYFILYFCSHLTANTNTDLYENVIQFLNYMHDKLECNIKIILISSDQSQQDFNLLLEDYKKNFTNFSTQTQTSWGNNFKKLALNFSCKCLKEKLIQELRISGIPWFSLINERTGEVLCENLKIFILNSQLREIII